MSAFCILRLYIKTITKLTLTFLLFTNKATFIGYILTIVPSKLTLCKEIISTQCYLFAVAKKLFTLLKKKFMKQNFTLQKRFIVLVALLVCTYTQAQTIWTGAENTKWNTPSNWSTAAIPAQGDDVVIPAGLTNYPLIEGLDGVAYANNLTVEDGALITVSGALSEAGVSNGSGSLYVSGAITANATIDATQGTIVTRGAYAQQLPAAAFVNGTIRNLTVYNSDIIAIPEAPILGSTTVVGNLNITGILGVTSGTLNTSNSLTLKSNAQTTAVIDKILSANATIVGEMTVERFIPARRAFRFMSSPTTGGTIRSNWQEGGADVAGFGTDITGEGGATNGFDVSGTNNPSLYTHNNTTLTWEPVTSTNANLVAGAPYRILVRGDRTVNQASSTATPTNTTLRSTGTVRTGTVNAFSELFTRNDAGFILLGNPYQAPVDMIDVMAETNNINDQYYYVWDPTIATRGGYVTVDLENGINNVPSSANNILQPNQAFFVQIALPLETNTSLTFREDHKKITFDNSTPQVYKSSNSDLAQIKVSMYTKESLTANGTATDGFVVNFNSAYSNDVTNADAVKPFNQDENLAIANAGKLLSIEKRAMPTATDVIAISNKTYRSSNYTYKVTVTGLNDVTAYLHDNYTGAITKLTNNEETSVNFTIDGNAASSAENRFNIEFKTTALGTDDYAKAGISVYPNPVQNNVFNIQVASAQNTDVVVFNSLGQQVACNVSAISGTTINVQPQSQLATGIYIVKITNNGVTETKKVIVK